MPILLDTHSLLWFIAGDKQLSDKAREMIFDMQNQLFVSIGSIWEMAIKISLGRLILSRPLETLLPEQLEINKIDILPIEIPHLVTLSTLPWHHRDPFDRLLISQAITEKIGIISKDSIFKNYPITVFW